MKEVSLQKSLIDRFKTLNKISGIDFLTDSNVSYPNKPFTKPDDKRWFEVTFLNNEPEVLADFYGNLSRWNGILQIDICTPLEKGEDEAYTKYEWISKIFRRGDTFDDIMIDNCYIADRETETDHYRTVVRVNWEADTDDEKE